MTEMTEITEPQRGDTKARRPDEEDRSTHAAGLLASVCLLRTDQRRWLDRLTARRNNLKPR
jgi:hypothetical protein